MKKIIKPTKKSDKDLNDLIITKINAQEYVFLKHAKQRQDERNISDMVVLNTLENQKGYKRKRNKNKDKYESDNEDWNYCYEGLNCDNERIRIIISFNSSLLLIITVIRLDD